MELISQVLAQLGVDSSLLPLLGLVFLLYLLLSAVYLKPFQRLLDERKEKTEGTKKEAELLTQKAEEKFAQYKTEFKAVTAEARKIFSKLEETARAEESKLVSEAQAKSKASLQEVQKQLDAEKKAVLDSLRAEIPKVASEIAAKALGRPINVR